MHQRKPTIRPVPAPGLVPLRGPSGRLYGYLDPATKTIEVKTARGGVSGQHAVEHIDLKPYLEP